MLSGERPVAIRQLLLVEMGRKAIRPLLRQSRPLSRSEDVSLDASAWCSHSSYLRSKNNSAGLKVTESTSCLSQSAHACPGFKDYFSHSSTSSQAQKNSPYYPDPLTSSTPSQTQKSSSHYPESLTSSISSQAQKSSSYCPESAVSSPILICFKGTQTHRSYTLIAPLSLIFLDAITSRYSNLITPLARTISMPLLEGRKRKWYESDTDDGNDHETGTRIWTPKEIVVIDDEDHTAGRGTVEDPIRFREFTTGNIIPDAQHGTIFTVDDDEEEEEMATTATNMGQGLRERRVSSVFPIEDDCEVQERVRGLSERDYSLSPNDYAFSRGKSSQSRGVSTDSRACFDNAISYRGHGPVFTDSESGNESDADDDDIPGASSSQDSNDSEQIETPSSSQLEDGIPLLGATEDTIHQESIFRPVIKECVDKSTCSIVQTEVFDKESEQKRREEENIQKKSLFFSAWAPHNIAHLESRLAKLRPAAMNVGECWLYPGPTHVWQSALKIYVTFSCEGRTYKYTINAGFVALLVHGLLTEAFKEGIIKHRWHASHLCGNWRCTNPMHLVAEPGGVNSRRNLCFYGHLSTCDHDPPCLKHLKLKESFVTREENHQSSQEVGLPSNSQRQW
ncbi:uncharacterized protein EI97DRAFT_504800 [Westerdykella ornata]|uniref:Zinc-binding loop region of homing endonuclease domain-containing protein n=1 Tax=Westerdykella ornata TaxID=318751 RepID=A0A6A6J688_WESOR|nr:uncharacterized protein EI97DRAFT_504800 [Westerdykella ornata]KAF2271653.1 hypothetical protein EI97DRAFT_504800 [Westerdykella ornata]